MVKEGGEDVLGVNSRMRLLLVSAMKTFPFPSTATPSGAINAAEVASPPSPLKPGVPLPATVLIVPAGVTIRMRSLPLSTMNRLPAPSTATSQGSNNSAEVAGPLSPLKPRVPLPATVLIVPAGVTFRIRLFIRSAMKRLPALSTATSLGWFSSAAVAGPPSPLKPAVPLPATVLIVPAAVTFRMRLLPSAMKRLPALSTAMPAGWNSSAEVAGPPSPLKPAVPLPATVLIVPAAVTFRMRLLVSSAMKRLPALSTATPSGSRSSAEVAGPPSPLKPRVPLPATVLIAPAGATFRMRALEVAALSPLKPAVRLPAPGGIVYLDGGGGDGVPVTATDDDEPV